MQHSSANTARREFAHDGDTISYPAGRVTVHLTRRGPADFYLVVTDHTGLAVSGKNTYFDEVTARNEARRAVYDFRADAESPAQVAARVTETAKAAPAPAPAEYRPVVWPQRARTGTRLWVSEPGLKILLLAMANGGWANSVRQFSIQSVKPLLDRGLVEAMQPVVKGGQWGRVLNNLDMDVVITRKGWTRALAELADIRTNGSPEQAARFAPYSQLLEDQAVAA